MLILEIIARTVSLFLAFEQFAMFGRAILSWFIRYEGNPIMTFLVLVTEPVILPFRLLLSRFEALERIPVDISFLVAYIALSLIQALLPALYL